MVQGSHANINNTLKRANVSLEKAFDDINRWYKGLEDVLVRHQDVNALSHDPTLIGTNLAKRMEPVCGKVSTFAYNMVIKKLSSAWETDYEACHCKVEVQFKLPCKHIHPYVSLPVTLEMFNRRWFLGTKLIDDLEANKATLPPGIDIPISDAINDTMPGMSLLQKGSSILLQLEDHLHSGTDRERLQLINSLQSLIPTSGAPIIELKHPLPVISSKGCPSTKRNKSAFELHEERANKKTKQWNKL
ncbi:hypothetical protein BJV82DRAFT_240003 [Fennellomyces sp. T-0311]|nr:hypothetical protein BJV82DRAFT_240003 [Fennellomyces sp. T-0311]